MTEEIAVEEQVKEELSKMGVNPEPEAKEPERELTDFEKEQYAEGWRPDGEKSAEEWARTAPLYKGLEARGKQIKQLQRTVDSMKELMMKQEKAAYAKAVADLEQQRRQAIEQGNAEAVDYIETQKNNLAPPAIQEEMHPSIAEFKEKHKAWLEGSSYEEMKMQDFVNRRDAELMKRGLAVEDHLQTLEEHVQKEFPEYFGIKSGRAQAVESAASSGVVRGKTGKRYVFADLSSEQKTVAKDFERMGVMPVNDYIKKLVELGELQ